MTGFIPLSETWTWGLLILFVSILVIGFFLGGRGKAFKWLKIVSVIGTVAIVMGAFIGPALMDVSVDGNGVNGFVPLFTLSMAISADCNDLTGLDAVADCAVAAELNFRSDDREMDVLFTIDQELVTVLHPEEQAVDFCIERYCEGEHDPVHCPMESGVFLPAAVNVELVSIPTIRNNTIAAQVPVIEKTAAGVDIISWSDGTNVVLGKHKASPLQLEPGEEGTITFSNEFDFVFFGADTITATTGVGKIVLSVAGQTVTIHLLVVGYTA